MRCKLPTENECSPEARAYTYRPPDPAWVGGELVARVRAELAAYDWRVTLWWDPFRSARDAELPGRWIVKEWLVGQNRWDTAFVIESDTGGYREPSTISIIRGLQDSNRKRSEVSGEIEKHNVENEKKRIAALREQLWAHTMEGRQLRDNKMVFGASGPRRRDTIQHGDYAHLMEGQRLRQELAKKTTPRLKNRT